MDSQKSVVTFVFLVLLGLLFFIMHKIAVSADGDVEPEIIWVKWIVTGVIVLNIVRLWIPSRHQRKFRRSIRGKMKS